MKLFKSSARGIVLGVVGILSGFPGIILAQDREPRAVFYSPNLSGQSAGIFDGQRRLLTLRRGRFAAIELIEGMRLFSASQNDHPDVDSQISMGLYSNDAYYYRLEAECGKARLVRVTCQIAQQEMTKSTPIEGTDAAPGVHVLPLPLRFLFACH
jgi:hypothetical protein